GWSAAAAEVARARGLRVLAVGEAGADLRLVARRPTALGQELDVVWQGEARCIALPLIGAYQAANALVAAGLALATGTPAAAVFDALARLQPVRGRLERAVITPAGAPAYVDYAHTPDALAAAIAALRPHTKGRLIVVFGAGGDRDAGKRPQMGAVAASAADIAILTDDNPRGEDPALIRAAIRAGMQGPAAVHDIADRQAAIATALGLASAGDVVLIAGKGHETGQIVGRAEEMRVIPFDDVAVARACVHEGVRGGTA
ncbi:MAG TPA: cyanophycin synthetase, partial [Novosphingobium sp.]|nr:cyanophycin synthetase [Novosphingobium sp.]